jgi:hypothetical protein
LNCRTGELSPPIYNFATAALAFVTPIGSLKPRFTVTSEDDDGHIRADIRVHDLRDGTKLAWAPLIPESEGDMLLGDQFCHMRRIMVTICRGYVAPRVFRLSIKTQLVTSEKSEVIASVRTIPAEIAYRSGYDPMSITSGGYIVQALPASKDGPELAWYKYKFGKNPSN